VVLDVAHNPHAAATLSQNLDNMGFHAYTYAVFGSMLDKDIDGVIAQLKDKVDHWYVTGLPLPRAATAAQLKQKLLDAGVLSDPKKPSSLLNRRKLPMQKPSARRVKMIE
jgi:dihydrofolate synthase/folylpolyglutamate synthase